MKIIAISDTHSRHQELELPEADIILHAGDIRKKEKKGVQEIADFIKWFASQKAKHKVFIAGNHDLFLEKEENFFRGILPEGVHYLNDESITIEGIKIWGSPVTPWFHEWAFNRYRGANIKQHWDKIPDDIDILLTHGPAKGILDSVGSEAVGCKDLMEKIKKLNKLKLHCFGHIHVQNGVKKIGDTFFVNASLVDSQYKIINIPYIFNIQNGEYDIET